jgi:hypothetical protein
MRSSTNSPSDPLLGQLQTQCFYATEISKVANHHKIGAHTLESREECSAVLKMKPELAHAWYQLCIKPALGLEYKAKLQVKHYNSKEQKFQDYLLIGAFPTSFDIPMDETEEERVQTMLVEGSAHEVEGDGSIQVGDGFGNVVRTHIENVIITNSNSIQYAEITVLCDVIKKVILPGPGRFKAGVEPPDLKHVR